MTDKLMYIPNDDTHNDLFCRFQLVVETFGHSSWWTNLSKFKYQRIRKRYYKTFGTSVINITLSPPSLIKKYL